jgi:hypothetical protein
VCSPIIARSIAFFGFPDLWQREKHAVDRHGKEINPTARSFTLDKGILAAVEKNARRGVGPLANFGLAPRGDREKGHAASMYVCFGPTGAWLVPWVKRLLRHAPSPRASNIFGARRSPATVPQCRISWSGKNYVASYGALRSLESRPDVFVHYGVFELCDPTSSSIPVDRALEIASFHLQKQEYAEQSSLTRDHPDHVRRLCADTVEPRRLALCLCTLARVLRDQTSRLPWPKSGVPTSVALCLADP